MLTVNRNEGVIVIVKQYGKTLTTTSNRVLIDVLRELGIPLRSDCSGTGVCGKCRVSIKGGNLTAPSDNEKKHLSHEELSQGYRLACQVKLIEGIFEVHIPIESTLQRYKSADVGFERQVPVLPAIRKIFIELPKASLNDNRADFERIVDAIKNYTDLLNGIDADIDVIQKVPETIRSNDWKITVVTWHGKKIIDVEMGDTRDNMYGLAIDIGTSKIVVHLVDLASGSTLAIESTPNPQASYGADIISRLAYALKSDENLGRLQELAVKAINTAINHIISRTGISKDRIYEAVVVGNTVMHHLFLGIQPKYLGYSPYVPAIARALTVKAKDLNISIHKSGIIYMLPVIAGYVGSDAIADAVAIDIENCETPCMLIDIGTNSEILLNDGKEIYACSTPAGPAFEGFGTAFGIKAVSGAIDQVYIYFDDSIQDFNVRYHTIGDDKPIGLCGSAFIDAIAHLYRLNIIDNKGKFVHGIKSRRIVRDRNTQLFVLAWSNETRIGMDISISAKDINEILLAKAAIAAGIRILTNIVKIDPIELKKIYIAGSFGTYINVENAIAVGLLPPVDPKKVEFIGNAAVSGAKICLKNTEIRRRAEELAKKIKYVELSAHPSFNKIFTDSVLLPQIPSHKEIYSTKNVLRS